MIHRVRSGEAGAMELEHEWAVILAGGDGTRLKSLSRGRSPVMNGQSSFVR